MRCDFYNALTASFDSFNGDPDTIAIKFLQGSPTQINAPPYPRIKDETNITNLWQGSLRFGWLDTDLLATTINNDLKKQRTSVKVTHGLAVTCLDQLDATATFIENEVTRTEPTDSLSETLKNKTGADFIIESHGPSRQYVNYKTSHNKNVALHN